MILIDANVLLRLIQIGHPHQRPAVDAIKLLLRRNRERCAICPQTLFEVYAVATRPVDAPNPGLGLSPAATMSQIEKFERQFRFEPEPETLLTCWKQLVVKYRVIGKSSHDARLAALMIERGISELLTFNDSHFRRYAEITVMNPFDVLGMDRA